MLQNRCFFHSALFKADLAISGNCCAKSWPGGIAAAARPTTDNKVAKGYQALVILSKMLEAAVQENGKEHWG